jgi:hypothetical protein
VTANDERRAAYRQAYEAWQTQLATLHAVLLDGTRTLLGAEMKGLLNREARAKQRYDEARLRLLGIEGGEDSPFE